MLKWSLPPFISPWRRVEDTCSPPLFLFVFSLSLSLFGFSSVFSQSLFGLFSVSFPFDFHLLPTKFGFFLALCFFGLHSFLALLALGYILLSFGFAFLFPLVVSVAAQAKQEQCQYDEHCASDVPAVIHVQPTQLLPIVNSVSLMLSIIRIPSRAAN